MERLPLLELTANPLLDGAIIVGLAVVAAVLADLFVSRVVRRLVASTSTELDDGIIALLHRPVYLSVFFFGVALAMRILGIGGAWFRLLETLAILVWAVALLRISTLVAAHPHRVLPGDSSAGEHLSTLLKNLAVVVIFVVAVMGVLSVWEVSITPLLASAGIVGAAVAFASKDTIANFLGGLSVLVDRPYSLGHFIVLESGERGEVVDIGLRSTRVKTRDDVLISVPNSLMANSKIVNESAPVKKFRVRIPVGVAYGSDMEQVESILLAAARDNGAVEKEPLPRVRFRSFGDSALDVELLCWIDEPVHRGRIVHELNLEVYRRFGAEGVTIPFPQRDVHLHRDL